MRKVKSFILLAKNFGIVSAIKWALYKVANDAKYDILCEKILMRKYKDFLPYKLSGDKCEVRYIWKMWWQGVDEMPEVVELCNISHIKFIPPEYKQVLITKENYSDYVTLPPEIMKKFNSGVIKMAQFSDIIRLHLLEKYGGLWIDMTLLLTNTLDNKIFEQDFYSVNLSGTDYTPRGGQIVTNARWAGFVMGTGYKHSTVFLYLKNVMVQYWLDNDVMLDYFLMNRFLRSAYNNSSIVYNIINNIPNTNRHIYSLQPILNTTQNHSKFEEMNKDTYMYKLSWKNSVVEMIDGNQTLFGWIKHIIS